jgi:hypothetical protein
MMYEYGALLAERKSRFFEENLPQFHSIHHKSYTGCPVNELTSLRQKAHVKLLEL